MLSIVALSRRDLREELLAGGPEANFSDPTHEMVGVVRNAGGNGWATNRNRLSAWAAPIPVFWRVAGMLARLRLLPPPAWAGIDESVSIEEFHHVLGSMRCRRGTI